MKPTNHIPTKPRAAVKQHSPSALIISSSLFVTMMLILQMLQNQ